MDAKAIADILINAFKSGNKLLICGNGGSAAQAQHFAGELVGKYTRWHKALPAIALTTDTSILTAMGNDLGQQTIFARQVEALGKPGDVLITISTSGKSVNLLNAAAIARNHSIIVIDLPRQGKETPRIQEYQLRVIHDICQYVEEAF